MFTYTIHLFNFKISDQPWTEDYCGSLTRGHTPIKISFELKNKIIVHQLIIKDWFNKHIHISIN